ncbi:MAG: hypothetical protein IPG67_00015 [Acidobacteria bacterium]|nr:hypothetical protein [Acidobacteriota bacterium]
MPSKKSASQTEQAIDSLLDNDAFGKPPVVTKYYADRRRVRDHNRPTGRSRLSNGLRRSTAKVPAATELSPISANTAASRRVRPTWSRSARDSATAPLRRLALLLRSRPTAPRQ